MQTCSEGFSSKSRMRGGTPPARRMPFLELSSMDRLAMVLAAISVTRLVLPASSSATNRCKAPDSRMELK